MPNGGSDCCGTCWFSENSGGQAGYPPERKPGPDRCVIRDLAIPRPFYTFCSNHPHRNPDRIREPLGPVFVGDDRGERRLWRPSPDYESVRLRLLDHVARLTRTPGPEYPIGMYADEVIVWQLGEFGERRALQDLRRVAGFTPGPVEGDPFQRRLEPLIRAALDAVEKIEGLRSPEFEEGEILEDRWWRSES